MLSPPNEQATYLGDCRLGKVMMLRSASCCKSSFSSKQSHGKENSAYLSGKRGGDRSLP